MKAKITVCLTTWRASEARAAVGDEPVIWRMTVTHYETGPLCSSYEGLFTVLDGHVTMATAHHPRAARGGLCDGEAICALQEVIETRAGRPALCQMRPVRYFHSLEQERSYLRAAPHHWAAEETSA